MKLSHPHIVKVTDVGSWEGTPFAVMQYLAGGSLEDQRRPGRTATFSHGIPGGLPLADRGRRGTRLHPHAGYVHRDVKPGNILFDALGHAFLSDFGVAKVLASSNNTPPSQTAMTGAGWCSVRPNTWRPS